MPRSNRRFIFFLNPKSRDGKTRLLFENLLKKTAFVENQHYHIEETSTISAMEQTLRTFDQDSIAVAVGGDGTVNMLAQAVLAEGRGITMGVVPFGTGNAIAHQLGASAAEKAITVLLEGKLQQIDCVTTNHPQAPLALISFSCGFESVLLHHYAMHRKKQRIISGVNALFQTIGPLHSGVYLELDGKTVQTEEEAFYNVGLYVIQKYAYGVDMNNRALLDDGLAECVIHKFGRRYWGDMLKAAVTHSPTGTSFTGHWRKALISSPEGLQCDGETLFGGTVELSVLPKALTFLAESDDGS